MSELAALFAAVCLLAFLIDHFRGYEITAQMVCLFNCRDRIEILGRRYKVVGRYMDRDVLRIRRSFRG